MVHAVLVRWKRTESATTVPLAPVVRMREIWLWHNQDYKGWQNSTAKSRILSFADGSVRFFPYAADPIMPALATRAGGEPESAAAY